MRFSAWLQLGVLLPGAALGALSSASAALPAREPPPNFNAEETVEALQHRLRDLRIEDAGGPPEVEHAIFLDAREYQECVDGAAIAPRIKKPLPVQPLLSRRDVEEGRRFAASRDTWCRVCRTVLIAVSIDVGVIGVQYLAGLEIRRLCHEPPISDAKTERLQRCWVAVGSACMLVHVATFLCLFVPTALYPRHLYEGLRFLEAREDKNIQDGVRLRLVCRGRSDLHEGDDMLAESSSSWEIAAAAAGGPASTGPRGDAGARRPEQPAAHSDSHARRSSGPARVAPWRLSRSGADALRTSQRLVVVGAPGAPTAQVVGRSSSVGNKGDGLRRSGGAGHVNVIADAERWEIESVSTSCTGPGPPSTWSVSTETDRDEEAGGADEEVAGGEERKRCSSITDLSEKLRRYKTYFPELQTFSNGAFFRLVLVHRGKEKCCCA